MSFSILFPFTSGLGSFKGVITLCIPDFMIESTQGGVLP